MKKKIDARGLACPRPVIMAKKAIEEGGDCVVMVDSESARENVCRMARALGCEIALEEGEEAARIHITRGDGPLVSEDAAPAVGPTVVVFPCDRMGRGDDELGDVLMRAFLHTLGEVSPGPDVVILLNSGVKLATEGSEVIEDLQSLESRGVGILVCGTCLDFFGLKEKLVAGAVSNMYDIAEIMLSAGRVIEI